jgi:hypothetical protein
MQRSKLAMGVISVLGGIAVLGSYVLEIARHPGQGDALWGNIPEWVRPYYSSWMPVAAVGYLTFTYFWFFRVDPERTRIGGRYSLGLVNWLYLLILIPSALWMPLTFAYLESPTRLGWVTVRLDLFAVALGALGMIWALAKVEPSEPRTSHRVALVGAFGFAVQCAILDPLVWPAFFPNLHGG